MSDQPLTHDQIVRAWKDEAYRYSLTEEQRKFAGEHYPSGEVELSEEEMAQIAGGRAGTGDSSCCWSSCN
ncbi:MAG: mersacidin/lichenicidin family type 2 lantibiotic [Chloroflexi bacterium]|nr:mersacidin/lichenicidin family type 2 lantibiotic [Chloroflexota bacterium]MCI0576023.1 mersacidin/lichenicidin family type 2 lantibiotic [Chloroflexota bacterium]MCI0645147.1 mersacidin/lichenicidin family type 2 lantibiotic [Chloroflexota bacterium]MCI0725627.1 mersacidin/lichenicidin family type 2 lantibiotic [Chloroflexota bacterium]